MSEAPEPLSYRVEAASIACGIPVSTIYEEIKAGRLVARKRGATTLILRSELLAYLEGLPLMGAAA